MKVLGVVAAPNVVAIDEHVGNSLLTSPVKKGSNKLRDHFNVNRRYAVHYNPDSDQKSLRGQLLYLCEKAHIYQLFGIKL